MNQTTLKKIIIDEIERPQYYEPITRGPWAAILIIILLLPLVPIWVIYQKLKSKLKSLKGALN